MSLICETCIRQKDMNEFCPKRLSKEGESCQQYHEADWSKIKQLQVKVTKLKIETIELGSLRTREGILKAKLKRKDGVIARVKAELKARYNQCDKSETKKAFDRYQGFTHHFLHYLQKIGVVTDTSDTVEDLQDKLQAELEKHRWIHMDKPPIKLHEEKSPYGGYWQISDEVWVLNILTKKITITKYVKYTDGWLCGLHNGFTYWKPIILPESEM